MIHMTVDRYLVATEVRRRYSDPTVKGLQKYGCLLRQGEGRAGGGQEASQLAFTTAGKVSQLRPDNTCLARWRGREVIAGEEWIGTTGRGYDLCCRPYLRSATRFGRSC